MQYLEEAEARDALTSEALATVEAQQLLEKEDFWKMRQYRRVCSWGCGRWGMC